MRVLLVNRFFGGEQVPTGRMLEDVANQLVAYGAEVSVLAGPGTYANETLRNRNSVRILRTIGFRKSGQFMSWLSYWVQALMIVPFGRWDACLLLTDPPFLPIIAPISKLLGSKRRILLWTMDLYPEALIADGMVRKNGWIHRVLREVNEICFPFLDGVIALGTRQTERLAKYRTWRKFRERTTVVPPWDLRDIRPDVQKSMELKKRFGWLGRRVVLYAGNLGRGHSFQDILSVAKLCLERNENWLFAFVCRGAKKDELIRKAQGLSNVFISDYVASEETNALLHAAHVHLITMADDWDGVVVPSKLYGILGTSTPILFVGPEQADTVREIERLEIGTSVSNGCTAEQLLFELEAISGRKYFADRDESGPDSIAKQLIGNPSNNRL
jgi:colanic acid biosynthesis glycosyl transferase WcaI